MAEEVAEKTHAKLSPSGAHRWTVCPGSVVLEDGMPDSSSHYARWGTCAHEGAGMILEKAVLFQGTKMTREKWDPTNAESFVGRVFQIEGHDLEFDMEMADCVNDYVAQVESFWEPGDIMIVEQPVPLEQITGEKDATGTSDCIIIKPRTQEIVVIDLKGGKGVQVDAEENQQGLMYAAGAAHEQELVYGPFKSVRVVIIQPRLQHVSEWSIEWDEFEERVNEIKIAAGRVVQQQVRVQLGKALDLEAGEKQCRFCKAKAICPALRGEVSAALHKTAGPAAIEEFEDLTLPKQASCAASFKDEAGSVDNDKLAEAMCAAPLVEEWLKAVRAEVERRLFDGQPVRGYKLVEGKRGSRFWADPAAVEDRLKRSRIKVDEMFTKTLISPTQAEKKLAENKKLWADLAEFIEQKDGKPSVAPADDKRQEWAPARAEEFPDLSADTEDLFA